MVTLPPVGAAPPSVGAQPAETRRTTAASDAAAGTQRLDRPRDSRPAEARPAAFTVDLKGATGADAVRDRVAEGLTNLFKIFYKADGLEETVEKALDSLTPVLQAATEDRADGVQIGLASIERFLGGSTGIRKFAVEAAVVEDGRVRAETVGLVDLSGQRIQLDLDQRRRGVETSVYQVADEPVAGAAGDAARARYDSLLGALDRLVQVQDALAAYRQGDPSGIKRLEQLLRGDESGTARATDALGRLGRSENGETERLYPGSGIVRG